MRTAAPLLAMLLLTTFFVLVGPVMANLIIDGGLSGNALAFFQRVPTLLYVLALCVIAGGIAGSIYYARR